MPRGVRIRYVEAAATTAEEATGCITHGPPTLAAQGGTGGRHRSGVHAGSTSGAAS